MRISSTLANLPIRNSVALTPPHTNSLPHFLSSVNLGYTSLSFVLEADTRFIKFLTGLTGPRSRNCTTWIRRHWQPTTLTVPCQYLNHTHTRSAACAICAAQIYNPKVWTNSSSGIASNTPSGAASCSPFIASGGERAGAITGAAVRSPTCSSICRTGAG